MSEQKKLSKKEKIEGFLMLIGILVVIFILAEIIAIIGLSFFK